MQSDQSAIRQIVLNNALGAVNFVRDFYGEPPLRRLKHFKESKFPTPIDAALRGSAEKAIREIAKLSQDDARVIARCFAFFLNRWEKGEYPQLTTSRDGRLAS